MTALLVVGVALEILGLALSGIGLAHTWSHQAADVRFFPALVSELSNLGAWLLRRPRAITARPESISTRAEMGAAGVAGSGWPPDLTLEAKVEHLLELHHKNALAASMAHSRADLAHRRLDTVSEEIRESVARLQHQMVAGFREVKLEGLPMTVFGLFIVGLGTLLQLVSQLASS